MPRFIWQNQDNTIQKNNKKNLNNGTLLCNDTEASL